MMSLSIWQILLVVVLFILLFGRGRIPALMADLAAGIRSFKQGIAEQEHTTTDQATSNEATSHKDSTAVAAVVHRDSQG